MKRVAVGMSGGVDSTVAAYLLKKQGFQVIGLTMKIWNDDFDFHSEKSGCYGPAEANDIRDASRAAAKIGIPHNIIDLSREYKDIVLKYFRLEYESGKTPNPCVMCNARIKFGVLLEKAYDSGLKFDSFATGHYAKVAFDRKRNIFLLKRAADKTKDQSYFLYRLTQGQLKKIMFPLAGLTKKEVKMIAGENGFSDFSAKPESQNFIECKDYAVLLKGSKGEIVDTKGNILGTHRGITHYTLGQRKKLKVGGQKQPLYVVKIDASNNKIIAGPKLLLFSRKAIIKNMNWIVPFESIKNTGIQAKYRYGSLLAGCKISDKTSSGAVVEFTQSQFALTPGQSLVLYDRGTVLGGGIIS